MSLINDALKRASTEKSKPGAPDSGNAGLTPAEDAPRSSSSGLPLVLCIVGIGALLVSGGLWLKSRGTGPLPEKSPVKSAVNAPSADAAASRSEAPAAASDAPRNPVERAAATLNRVQQRNSEGEAEADNMTGVPAASAKNNIAAPEAKNEASASVKSAPAETKSEPLAKVTPAPAPAPEPLRLQAIYYRMKGPSVVINGRTLKRGDSVNGAKVTAIHRTEVEVERNGETQTLTLH